MTTETPERAAARSLWLTQAEVDAACYPVTQVAAQVRYLRSLGMVVEHRPGGRAIVVRSHAERVLSMRPDERAAPGSATAAPASPAPQQPRPNRAALVQLLRPGRGQA